MEITTKFIKEVFSQNNKDDNLKNKVNKCLLRDFYDASSLFEDNLYLLTFALNYFHYKNVTVSKLKDCVENQRLSKIWEGLDVLLFLNPNTITSFKNAFWLLNEDDEYEAYLNIYMKMR